MAESMDQKSTDKMQSTSNGPPPKMAKIDETSNVAKGAPRTLFPGFKDFNDFSQIALKTLMLSIKNSNALPSEGDDFDYYSSFHSVSQELDRQGTRLLDKIQDMMRYHGVRGNISSTSSAVDIDDRFDVLVDSNDQLLERVGTYLDEASGLKRDVPLMVVSKTTKMSAANNWNKSDLNSSAGTINVGFKLITAKNIARPQLTFKDKVDNTNRPFVPKITYKPNALKPLEECMIVSLPEDEEDIDPSFTYPHPYQYELDHFTPLPHQITKVEPKDPSSMDAEPFYIDEEEDLHALCTALKDVTEIAIDLEHHHYRSFLGFTCLMQISTRTDDYIIDTFKLRHELHILNEVFTDPNIVKVFHGADYDILWLQRDLGLYIVNMFDSGLASRALSYKKFSLAYLLDYYCQVTADKQYQMADWRIRPLPKEFMKYAREDTHYLLYIYDKLKNDLIDADNGQTNLISTVISRSTLLCAKKYSKPAFTESTYKEVHRESKKTFNAKQMNALKGLVEWRDRIARQEDESTGYVLRNHMMIQMAELLPRETGGVLACCNPLPPLVRQHVSDLHAIIKNTRDTPVQQVAPIKPVVLRPSPLQHPKYSLDCLTCPHDLSQRDSESDGESSAGLEDIVVTTRCFSDFFSLTNNNTAKKQKSRKSTRRIVDEVTASFVDPFLKYWPRDPVRPETRAANNVPAQAAKQEESVWKLLPNTIKVVEVKPATVLHVIKTAARLAFSAEEEEAEETTHIFTLRQQVSDEKQSSIVTKSQATGTTTEEEVVKKKGKKRKSVDVVDAGEETTFTPRDYNQKEFNELLDGKPTGKSKDKKNKKKKKKEYNPEDARTADSDFKVCKAAAKPRHTQAGSNKSMTYTPGSNTATPKIQWPGN